MFTEKLCIECDACIDICPTGLPDHHRERHGGGAAHAADGAAQEPHPGLFVSAPLPQTGRVMVKDEDLCVHCGLCAERCPTAAWDMQKSTHQPALRRTTTNGPDPQATQDRVNDFTVKIANVNGTGSASANSLLMKAFFRMGIPVAGKNYFPSNIQGLPTWYEIRVSKDGYLSRSGRVDVMVAMNAETYRKDLREVARAAT